MQLNKSEYQFFCELMRDNFGIALDEASYDKIVLKLDRIANDYHIPNIKTLLNEVQENEDVKSKIVSAVTVNESSFFRDPNFFTHLQNNFLPKLISRTGKKEISIWSAAASTGQEAASLAIICEELKQKKVLDKYQILATDIVRDNVELGKQALYTQFQVQRGLSMIRLISNFAKVGLSWQLKDHLRANIKYAEHNLLHPLANCEKSFDVILLRNVLYYCEDNTRNKIMNNVIPCLNHSGIFALGGTEDFEYQKWGLSKFEEYNCYYQGL